MRELNFNKGRKQPTGFSLLVVSPLGSIGFLTIQTINVCGVSESGTSISAEIRNHLLQQDQAMVEALVFRSRRTSQIAQLASRPRVIA
jgi:hypothetical protein